MEERWCPKNILQALSEVIDVSCLHYKTNVHNVHELKDNRGYVIYCLSTHFLVLAKSILELLVCFITQATLQLLYEAGYICPLTHLRLLLLIMFCHDAQSVSHHGSTVCMITLATVMIFLVGGLMIKLLAEDGCWATVD